MRWNLDKLYKSFDCKEFKSDLKKLDSEINSVIDWADKELNNWDNKAEKIEWWFNKQITLGHLMARIYSYSYLVVSVDAKNATAPKYLELINMKHSDLTKQTTMFDKWLTKIEDLDGVINESDFLKQCSFILNETVEKSKYLLDEEKEVIISKLRNTGSRAWTRLWEVTTSNHVVEIEIDGEVKKLPLPVIRNMACDKDPEKRKKAYYAEIKSYEKIAESAAAAINGVKGETITISSLRGYDSVLDMTLKNSRLDRETLDAMLEAMKDSFPMFRKYYRKKAELLGHKDGLPFYDVLAPMGKAEMKFTLDEARDFIIDNFSNFSSELSEFAKNAFDNKWIDSEVREGKMGGAYCYPLHVIGESRVMSNFTGTLSDVSTLAHELGHAFHGHNLKSELYLNTSYPMPLAETASIFCETLIMNAAFEKADMDGKFTILESSISDSAQVIVDIYSRYYFETELLKRRENSSLSVDELNEIMLEAQNVAYGDGLDKEIKHQYMWVNKPHYYFSDSNFYNFPYAFGLLFARGLYAEYKKRGSDFVEGYNNLLKESGKNSIKEVAGLMDIDITKKEFWENSLQTVYDEIEEFIKIS